MFEEMGQFRVVVVTGPQRSGTTVCARAIAMDTGLGYVDEEDVGFVRPCFFDMAAFWQVVELSAGVVIQAPGACHLAHLLGRDGSVAVVLMRRPVDEIVASQERIGWGCELSELAMYGCCAGRIAEVKYYWWERYQKARVANGFEVKYGSLREHPLWVPTEERAGFGPRQWTLTPCPSPRGRGG